MTETAPQKIAVIRLGALGDFVQSMGPFKAIRDHHGQARITLLTTPSFAALARASGYFDEVWSDGRPSGLLGFLKFARKWRGRKFDRVYDLQTSGRSSNYFHLLWPRRPEWSGIAAGATHPHANPKRAAMHTIDRQAEQLASAGISTTPPADLSWATGDTEKYDLPDRYALLVPGGAPHRPAKRWPAQNYGALANALTEREITPVIIGTAAEANEARNIIDACPIAVSLIGETSFEEIVCLARKAVLAIGNDTGPMHLIAVGGAPSVVLFSHESDPARCAPRGPSVQVLRKPDLRELKIEEVLTATATVLEGRR
jgi:ADP-heptose:LPS heptosyltransferase